MQAIIYLSRGILHCWAKWWCQLSGLLNVRVIRLIRVRHSDFMIWKTLNQTEDGRGTAVLQWTRQTRSQTDKQWEEGQVKCARNVTDSWGRHVDPGPHATWQVPGVPPSSPRSHTDVKSPWRKPGCFCWGSHIRGKDGEESPSAGCLVKTGLLYGVVLASGQGHEAGPERGPHGHKLWGQNLNITSINAWPKYCVCETEFSISSPDLNWHLGFLHLLWQILALVNDHHFPDSTSLTYSNCLQQ